METHLAGAAGVLLFHQSALAILHALQLSRSAPFSFTPTPPLGIPLVWSLAFWGGVWGIVLAAAGIGLYLFGRRH